MKEENIKGEYQRKVDKEDNKPLFIIYRAEVIDCLNDMLDYWTELAQQNGFSGMKYAYQNLTFDLMPNKDDSRFDYNIEFQPSYLRRFCSWLLSAVF